MAKKLTFKVELLQAEDSSATGIEAPFSVQEVFGTKARVPVPRHHQRLGVSLIADAHGWLPHDGGQPRPA